MKWQETASSFALMGEKDIISFSLSPEECEEILTLFNRSVSNAQSGGGDIAMIAMKKILTRYPNWGEAVLLYGICLAIEGRFARAKASFEHVLRVGFLTVDYTDLASFCYQQAQEEIHAQQEAARQREERPRGISAVFSGKKGKSGFDRKPDADVIPMQTPILSRVPKNAAKVRFATDRERRNVLMQGNVPESDMPDEELDVSIPKTPAEKLRLAAIIALSVLVAVALGLVVWFFVIPGIQSLRQGNIHEEKLNYLTKLMEQKNDDPEVSAIVESFQRQFADSAE